MWQAIADIKNKVFDSLKSIALQTACGGKSAAGVCNRRSEAENSVFNIEAYKKV